MTRFLPDKEIIQTLCKLWRVDNLEFIAKYKRISPVSKIGYFMNFRANDRRIFYPKSEERSFNREVKLKINHLNPNVIYRVLPAVVIIS